MQRGLPDNWREIEARVIRLADALAGRLPAQDVEMAKSLARAGEWGIALEHLMTQIYEYDVAIPATLHREIGELGGAMKLDERAWRILRVTQGASSVGTASDIQAFRRVLDAHMVRTADEVRKAGLAVQSGSWSNERIAMAYFSCLPPRSADQATIDATVCVAAGPGGLAFEADLAWSDGRIIEGIAREQLSGPPWDDVRAKADELAKRASAALARRFQALGPDG
jgi:hypothetical protein